MTVKDQKKVLSEKAKRVAPSATLAITAKAKALKEQGIPVINFAGGEPDWDTPEIVKEEAVRAMKEGFTKYTPSAGIPSLKKAICKKLEQENGITVAPEQVIVSSGAKQSIYNAILALVDPGDELLLPAPYWVSYPEMVGLADGMTVTLGTTEEAGFKITATQLAKSVTKKSKVLLLNSPSNPTGAVYSRGELELIGEIVLENDLYVISDEIYDRLYYNAEGAPSIAAISKDLADRTIIINGASKSYSMTGWRIGFAAGPKEIIAAMGRIQDQTTSCASSISQRAAVVAFERGKQFANDLRVEYHKRRDLMLAEIEKVPGWSCYPPEGAFFCFANISKTGKDAETLANELLEKHHIAVIPGTSFGAPYHLRLSFCVSQEIIREGFERIRG